MAATDTLGGDATGAGDLPAFADTTEDAERPSPNQTLPRFDQVSSSRWDLRLVSAAPGHTGARAPQNAPRARSW